LISQRVKKYVANSPAPSKIGDEIPITLPAPLASWIGRPGTMLPSLASVTARQLNLAVEFLSPLFCRLPMETEGRGGKTIPDDKDAEEEEDDEVGLVPPPVTVEIGATVRADVNEEAEEVEELWSTSSRPQTSMIGQEMYPVML